MQWNLTPIRAGRAQPGLLKGRILLHPAVRFALCGSILFASQSAAADADCGRDPTLIVPGKCVGKITSSTRYRDLKALLPGHTIARGLSGSEGIYECGTFIDPDTTAQIYIGWSGSVKFPDDISDSKRARRECRTVDFGSDRVAGIEIPGRGIVLLPDGSEHGSTGGKGAPWHTAEGIRIGTTFLALRKLLPGGFKIQGWGWDYGGRTRFGDQMRAIMSYNEADRRRLTPEEMESLLGDKEIALSNDALNKLNPVVESFSVDLG